MNFKNIKLTTLVVAILATLSSCEDVVPVDLENGSSQLTVDAFLNDQDLPVIKLVNSKNYFDNSSIDYENDAIVSVTDGTNTFEFTYEDESYTYPEVIAFEEGVEYKLIIEVDDNVYEARSMAQPVPPIEAILYESEDGTFGNPDGYLAEFISFDLAGREDFYWIKHFRNDTLMSDPSSIIFSQDAAFQGNDADGLLFIPPIRQGINDFSRFYEVDEKLRVELWSINQDVYEFLNEVIEQSTNEGILATPSYNLRTNMTTVSGSDELGAIGNFSVSKVSSSEVIFE